MRLLLIRHGHRASSVGSDEGLSEQGQKQVADLCTRLQKNLSTTGGRIVSSPKRRCLETAKILAGTLSLPVDTEDLLDECRSHESLADLSRRGDDFLLALKARQWGEFVIVVSHSDWLECFADSLTAGRPSLSWGFASAHLLELTPLSVHYAATL